MALRRRSRVANGDEHFDYVTVLGARARLAYVLGETPRNTMEEDLASDVDTGAADSGPSGLWSGQLTEEERLAWKEQRQKRDRLSDTIGQYLLKGYRMLDANCQVCANILLQTRDGTNICLNCDDVEDNAAVTAIEHSTAISDAAPAQLHNQPQSHTHQTEAGSGMSPSNNPPNQEHSVASTEALVPSEKAPDHSKSSELVTKTLQMSEETLVTKLQWASRELAGSTSVDQSTQLCLLIKSCTDALQSVRVLQQQATAGHADTVDCPHSS